VLPLSCVWLCAATDGAKSSITTAFAVSNSSTLFTRHLPKSSSPHNTLTLPGTHILSHMSGMRQGTARTTFIVRTGPTHTRKRSAVVAIGVNRHGVGSDNSAR
jgi:hypothetical protein